MNTSVLIDHMIKPMIDNGCHESRSNSYLSPLTLHSKMVLIDGMKISQTSLGKNLI